MRDRRKWAPEEDEILRREASLQMERGQLKQWNLVAASLPGRTNKDCRKRWAKLGSNINKGPWSAEEDEKLQAAVQELGCRWTQVAKRVVTRHAEQCAKHWQNSLDPSIDHTKWGDDDEKLLKCVQQCGRNWTTIREQHFPTRSATDLKNRYTILTRKQRRATESSAIDRANEEQLVPLRAVESTGQDNEDEDDSMDEDDDDEYDDEDSSDNEMGGESLALESKAVAPQELFPEHFEQSDIFQFGDTMQNVDSAFFSPGSALFSPGGASTTEMTWDVTMPMGDYLPTGRPPVGSETSSSYQQTPPSLDDIAHHDVGMLKPVAGFGELVHADPDTSWIGIHGEPSHTSLSASPSQTTLILENVHPEALKSVMSILIETNTKMTVQRHK